MNKSIGNKLAELESALAAADTVPARISVLNELAVTLRYSNVERSRAYAEEALKLSDENNFTAGKPKALRMIASAEDLANHPGEALSLMHEARSLAESLNDTDEIIGCNNLTGKIYIQLGDLAGALALYQENHRLATAVNNKRLQADALLTEAVVHFRNNDFESCRPLFEKSLELAREINYEDGIGRALLNLSATLIETGHYEPALHIAREAMVIFEKSGNNVDLAHAVANSGASCCALGRYDEALALFMQVREIRSGLNDVANLPNSYISTCEVFIFSGRYDEAKRDLDIARKLAEPLKSILTDLYIAEMEARLLEATGHYSEALTAFKKYHELTKKYSSEERNRDLRNLRLRFEYEKLEKEKELYRLHSIETEEANRKISAQRTLLEQKNKDITDSIHYASRIQHSLLPAESLLRSLFPESFILYRPKDIVSGDFYWCTENETQALLVVADCTGHGVPGALMSMIGHNLLDQICSTMTSFSPAAILSGLDKGVYSILKQDSEGEGGNDGMDIAVCVYDRNTNEIIFAGARRPLWLLRNHEITEFKGTRNPVGGKRNSNHVYEETRIASQPGDRWFCFTDGYADQFGGPEGKKFQSMRLRQLVMTLQDESPEAQAAKLDEAWMAWKGGHEQIDDVLIAGFAT